MSSRSAGASASASGTSGEASGDDEQLEAVAVDPGAPVAHDAEHDHDLEHEDEPDDPVAGGLDDGERAVRVRQVQREQRQHGDGGDEHGGAQAPLPEGAARVVCRKIGHRSGANGMHR